MAAVTKEGQDRGMSQYMWSGHDAPIGPMTERETKAARYIEWRLRTQGEPGVARAVQTGPDHFDVFVVALLRGRAAGA